MIEIKPHVNQRAITPLMTEVLEVLKENSKNNRCFLTVKALSKLYVKKTGVKLSQPRQGMAWKLNSLARKGFIEIIPRHYKITKKGIQQNSLN